MNCIAVTSGKGGTGKSCVAAYTGMALSEQNKKTILVEAGADARSLDVIIAAQNTAVFDISDVLEGRCELREAVATATFAEDLHLLVAPVDRYQPDQEKLTALLRRLRSEYDYILVDGVDLSEFSPKLFDNILMVTTPDTLSVRACQQRVSRLYADGAKSIRLVINDVPAQIQPIHGAQDFDDVINMIGAQLIAVIPQSPKLHYSANNAKPLDEESITVQVFDNLAARLRGQLRPLLIC